MASQGGGRDFRPPSSGRGRHGPSQDGGAAGAARLETPAAFWLTFSPQVLECAGVTQEGARRVVAPGDSWGLPVGLAPHRALLGGRWPQHRTANTSADGAGDGRSYVQCSEASRECVMCVWGSWAEVGLPFLGWEAGCGPWGLGRAVCSPCLAQGGDTAYGPGHPGQAQLWALVSSGLQP